VNLKSVRLALQADPAGKEVRVIAETPSEGLQISNRLSLGREACGDWREQVRPAVSGLTIELSGSFPAACGEKALQLAPWPADVQVEGLFRALWRELGGSFGWPRACRSRACRRAHAGSARVPCARRDRS
jgi:D-alanyl-D-alanine carboxypeptidase/D-alanyl-D-alanine-endopeptidase (penicillin-binding protein 4)